MKQFTCSFELIEEIQRELSRYYFTEDDEYTNEDTYALGNKLAEEIVKQKGDV
jgi:hypothetical protein